MPRRSEDRESGGGRCLTSSSEDWIEGEGVDRLWKRHAQNIYSQFGLQASPKPETVRLVRETQHLPPHGYSREGPSLVLSQEISNADVPLEGIVASEALRSAIDELAICSEAKTDISMEYARQALSGTDEEKWREWWAETYPKQRVSPNLLHHPARVFTRLYSIAGIEGIHSLLRMVRAVSGTQDELGLVDYVRLLHVRIREMSSSLNETELLIAAELTRSHNVTLKEVAEKTDFSPQWVSKNVREMKKRGVLREFQHIRFSKVGIRMFNVLLASSREEVDPLELVENCPFLYGYRRILTGRWTLHAVLTVPDSVHNIKAIEQLPAYGKKWGVLVDISEVSSSCTRFAFEHYDCQSQAWRIPWQSIREAAALLLNGHLDMDPVELEYAEQGIKYQLDRLDIEIMDAIRRRLPNIAAIRRDVQASQNKVASKVQKLRDLGVIVIRREVHNIGLNEGVVIKTQGESLVPELLAWVNYLPRSITSLDTAGNLFVSSYLPPGGAYGAIRAAREFGPDVSVNVVGDYVYGGWGFPAELWDKDRQLWTAPRERIMDWIELLR